MRLLFIGAHPADLVDLAAGTIANHVKAGDEVFVYGATFGLYSHPLPLEQMRQLADDEYTELDWAKVDECKNALEMLGISSENWIFDNRADGLYLNDNAMGHFTVQLAIKITKIKPDVLITHHPMEANHPNHALIGSATIDAVVAAGRWIENWYADRFVPHSVSNVFFYGYLFRPTMVKLGRNVLPPDVVVDITEVIELKARAFQAMPSQYNTEEVVWARLNSMEREQGRLYGLKYAETFISQQPCKTNLLPDFGSANFQSLLKEQAEGGK